jgi:hypothetical protein
MIEYVPYVSLDFELSMRPRRQQQSAESGEKKEKSSIHRVGKVRGWMTKHPLKI